MKRRKVIALMIANAGLRNDYQGLLREGIERFCVAHDVDLWSYAGRSDWRPCGPAQGRVYQLVAPDRVDGIILAAGCIASFLSLEELLSTLNQRCPVPVCAVGYRVPGIPSLTIDNRQGTAQVVEHLVREDFGCGIPDEHVPRVLEPFFTSKQQTERGGTGLGLAIVHQVVKQSHGYVQVRSVVGQGTTFALYLPIVAQASTVSSIPPAKPIGGSERILVVDDEPIQLRTAKRILGQLGYRVVTAESGEAALELFARCDPAQPYHLVILDMVMGGPLNGLATLERLRQLKPGQKAMIASGYTPERVSQDAAGANVVWLAKPYTAAALAEAVREALASDESEIRSCPDPTHPSVANP